MHEKECGYLHIPYLAMIMSLMDSVLTKFLKIVATTSLTEEVKRILYVVLSFYIIKKLLYNLNHLRDIKEEFSITTPVNI